jgi:hypothetical protein
VWMGLDKTNDVCMYVPIPYDMYSSDLDDIYIIYIV